MLNKTFSFVILLFLVACSTATKSTLLGSAVGGTVGAFLGAAANSSDPQRGSTTGAFVGAGIGGLIGYASYQGEEKKKAKASMAPISLRAEGEFTPSYSQPIIKRVRIEDKIEDGKYIMGHDVWLLEQPAQWRKTK